MHLLRHGALLALILTGCVPRPAPAEGQAPTTAPAAAPRGETLTIDLSADAGPFLPRAAGRLGPGQPATLPRAVGLPLAPMFPPRTTTAPTSPPTLITLSRQARFSGAWPGEKDDWRAWDESVESLVRRTSAEGRPVEWEVWDEPEKKASFKGERLDFFRLWRRTVTRIRALDAGAVIVGPSVGKYDFGWVQEFLKVAKEYAVRPDVVTWHEATVKPELPGHVGGLEESSWQDGADVRRVRISLAPADARRGNPALPVFLLADVEKAHAENAFRGLWEEHGFALCDLLTAEAKPRSTWYTYRGYAGLAGRRVKVSGGPTADAVAAWVGASGAVSAVVGRDRARDGSAKANAPPLGPVTLLLSHVPGRAVHAIGRRIANSGEQELPEPPVTLEADVIVSAGEARIVLPDLGNGEAYLVTLTVAPFEER